MRVGDSATATVVTSSPTGLTFRAPARVAGTYDVHVFATDGTEDVLTAALTYVDGAGAGSPGTGTGTGTPGTGTAGHRDPGHARNGHRDRRFGLGVGHRLRLRAPAPAARVGSGGDAGPVVVTGPGGERLVRTTKFAALGGIWSMDCSSSCGGVAI